MRYEGPIYRPPSEADSLLVQATVGCPHNRCTFCMVYPNLTRITVYGSFQYIHQKGLEEMKRLAEAGLSRIHVGLESGDDVVLRRIRKGTDSRQAIEAGQWVMTTGIELSLYVMLGIGGKDRTLQHATETVGVLNAISPDFIRLRTFLPKVDTALLEDVIAGRFQVLGPHAVLRETRQIIEGLTATSRLTSDHFTNYIDLEGQMPGDRSRLLAQIDSALKRDESTFRPFYIGTQ